MLYEDEYSRAKIESERVDRAYENWDFGRPGILDGWPNYIAYFDASRDRCLDILRDKGIPLRII